MIVEKAIRKTNVPYTALMRNVAAQHIGYISQLDCIIWVVRVKHTHLDTSTEFWKYTVKTIIGFITLSSLE